MSQTKTKIKKRKTRSDKITPSTFRDSYLRVCRLIHFHRIKKASIEAILSLSQGRDPFIAMTKRFLEEEKKLLRLTEYDIGFLEEVKNRMADDMNKILLNKNLTINRKPKKSKRP